MMVAGIRRDGKSLIASRKMTGRILMFKMGTPIRSNIRPAQRQASWKSSIPLSSPLPRTVAERPKHIPERTRMRSFLIS
jgi:hypothetical protein